MNARLSSHSIFPHSICYSTVYPSLSPLQCLLPFSVWWRIISHDFGCMLCLKGDSRGTLRVASLNFALFFTLLPVMIMDVVWATVSSCFTWHASHTCCPTSCQQAASVFDPFGMPLLSKLWLTQPLPGLGRVTKLCKYISDASIATGSLCQTTKLLQIKIIHPWYLL